MKTAMAVALFGGICFAASTARADFSCGAKAGSSGSVDYEDVFCDDGLLGVYAASATGMSPVPVKGRRLLIHPPRIQFVQELLKSVENM
jgi:hypothetical protein